MSADVLPVYIGFDRREAIAWEVCAYSMWRRTSIPLLTTKLDQRGLRQGRYYWRETDPLASTEFTYTRFLTPALARASGFRGWALFCDCDILWLGDVAELFAIADDRKAVMCVHHDHVPSEIVKMDGAVQTRYRRKNWSSVVLWNLGHPANLPLTVEEVNTRPGSYLHQFGWLADGLVGWLPVEWNWLEGWSDPAVRPKAVHFTRGGPWHADYRDVAYADRWRAERAVFEAHLQASTLPTRGGIPVSVAE